MSRRPASFTQADVARIIRAARQAGAAEIELRVNGEPVIIRLIPKADAERSPIAPDAEVVL